MLLQISNIYDIIYILERSDNMFEKYLVDYYTKRIGATEICEIEGVPVHFFHLYLSKNNLPSRFIVLNGIDTGDKALDKTLKIKYSSMSNRCRGKATDKYGHYNGLAYMSVFEWRDFCNSNKGILLEMWCNYIDRGKKLKYAISIDRIDERKGYIIDNVQFRINGFNSWKRNLFPVKVTHNNVEMFFMSSEEASRYYGLRRQDIGECLNKAKYHIKGYEVESSDVERVLMETNIKTLEEYYFDKII